jgi:hypothetical protein
MALIDHPELRLQYGEAGRRLVSEEFDAGVNYRRLPTVLKSVADGRRRGRTQPAEDAGLTVPGMRNAGA